MAKKERTEEEIAERKAASKAKKAAKRAALISVLTFVKGRKNVPDEILAAVRAVTPGARVGGAGVASKMSQVADFFKENAEATELEIFTQFKAGRAEMRKYGMQMIKKLKPEDRLWVRLDVDSETYVVEGSGADAPKGWTGYTPVMIEDEEIL